MITQQQGGETHSGSLTLVPSMSVANLLMCGNVTPISEPGASNRQREMKAPLAVAAGVNRAKSNSDCLRGDQLWGQSGSKGPENFCVAIPDAASCSCCCRWNDVVRQQLRRPKFSGKQRRSSRRADAEARSGGRLAATAAKTGHSAKGSNGRARRPLGLLSRTRA
jgi:hypothetical protein